MTIWRVSFYDSEIGMHGERFFKTKEKALKYIKVAKENFKYTNENIDYERIGVE